jgi:hypothetical protein
MAAITSAERKLRVALVWNGTVQQEEELDAPRPIYLDARRTEGQRAPWWRRLPAFVVYAALLSGALWVLRLPFFDERVHALRHWGALAAWLLMALLGLVWLLRPRPAIETVLAMPGPLLDEDRVLLFEPADQGYRLVTHRLTDAIGGAIWLGGQRHEARELARRGVIDLGPDDYGVITIGPAAVFFQYVRPARRPGVQFEWSGAGVASFVLSAWVHAAILLLLLIARAEMDDPDPLELPADLIRRFMVTPPPEDILQQQRVRGTETDDPGIQHREEAGGRQAEREEGRVGRRDARQERTEMQGEVTGGAAARVRRLGLLGVLADSGADRSPLAALREGPRISDILGGLGSSRMIYGRGSGGTGLRGEGGGGGATGPGTLFGGGGVGTGVGSFGVGPGGGHGRGGPGASGRARGETRIAVETESPRVNGYLSPEQIMRVVRQNMAQIRYCYETELQRQPSLRGRIEVAWRINLQGAVTTSRVGRSTMGNPRVEGCIVRQVRTWRFPQPDGGEVDVHFPFVFGLQGG